MDNVPSIIFVCLGNICRSPLAEAVLKRMAEEAKIPLRIESCGIGDWFLGHLPDPRTRDSALRRGYVVSGRAQLFLEKYFEEFDYILVADRQVLDHLRTKAGSLERQSKIHLITHFASLAKGMEIPDPFYQEEAFFDHVLDIVEESCRALLDHIQNKKRSR